MLVPIGDDFIKPEAVSYIKKLRRPCMSKRDGGEIEVTHVAHLDPSHMIIDEGKQAPSIFITKEEADRLIEASR